MSVGHQHLQRVEAAGELSPDEYVPAIIALVRRMSAADSLDVDDQQQK